MMLSDVCLSRTSGLSREQRGLERPKLAEVAHVTRDLDTNFKVKRSRSPSCYTHRGVYTSGSCIGERGKVFTLGTYCYVAVCRRGGAKRFGAHRGSRGAGAYRGGLQLVIILLQSEEQPWLYV